MGSIINKLFKIPFLQSLCHYLDNKEHTLVNRHKAYVLTFYTFLMITVSISTFTIQLFTGKIKLALLGYAFIVVVTIPLVMYFRDKISVKKALLSNMLASQIVLSIQLAIFSFHFDQYNNNMKMAMVFYHIPMFLNVTLSIVAFQKRCGLYLAIISSVTFIFFAIITQNELFVESAPIITFMYIIVGLLGERVVRVTDTIAKENIKLKEDEYRLFNILKLKKQKVMEYVELAETDPDKIDTKTLFDFFDDKSKNNIVESVKKYLAAKNVQKVNISDQLPDLTQSELEVARLIVLGKKQGDICSLLNKTDSNISTVRHNIRKKLNLNANEDLYEALKLRLKN